MRNSHKIPSNIPIHSLNIKEHFNNLNQKQKLYCYYLYKASWAGMPIVFKQVSPESWDIFLMFYDIFKNNSINDIKKKVKDNSLENNINSFFNYVAIFFGNMGNYYSYGDKKFIPDIKRQKFEKIVKLFIKNKNSKQIIDKIYSINKNNKMLGYPEEGVTSYYSKNLAKKEIKLINKYMTSINMSPYNTTVVKNKVGKDNIYLIQVASEKTPIEKTIFKIDNFEGHKIGIIYESYSNEMKNIIKYLKEAHKYTSNKHQSNMIEMYIKHFEEGDINDHKKSQKHWIKDKGPIIETNMGFIESYRDPSGIRGEFESFVAVVNKKMSIRFENLVKKSNIFIKELPWEKEFEKDKFLKPDFTSLEIVTFVGSGIPLGINIPNYDDIRQTFGFKNVSLGNILRSSLTPSKEKIKYINDFDQDLYRKYVKDAFEIQVGGHELFGHGSGKLFMEMNDNVYNFDRNLINPLTKKKISSWYKIGETYDTVFGSLGSPYEECRAECVGLYLSTIPEMRKIFGFDNDDIMYINWLHMIKSGVTGLLMYDIEDKKWGQAHCWARYVIFNVLNESKIFELDIKDNYFTITLDKSKILNKGMSSLKKFMIKLQIYKSTANVKKAKELFYKYSKISNNILELIKIIEKNKKPKAIYIQPSFNLKNSNIKIKEYSTDSIGIIRSFMNNVHIFQHLQTYK